MRHLFIIITHASIKCRRLGGYHRIHRRKAAGLSQSHIQQNERIEWLTGSSGRSSRQQQHGECCWPTVVVQEAQDVYQPRRESPPTRAIQLGRLVDEDAAAADKDAHQKDCDQKAQVGQALLGQEQGLQDQCQDHEAQQTTSRLRLGTRYFCLFLILLDLDLDVVALWRK